MKELTKRQTAERKEGGEKNIWEKLVVYQE